MANRRSFIKQSIVVGAAALFPFKLTKGITDQPNASDFNTFQSGPLVVSTWKHGLAANEAAMKVLKSGGTALDAVEQGVWVPEADPEVNSVGLGGLPDAEGNVTLDACIMAPDGNAGSVAYLQHILHPVSVARRVMEKTPHLILAGEGALKFALDNGFEKVNLLTEYSKAEWKKWKASGARYAPTANWENHDTIGLLAIGTAGEIAGACTTSGMAFKHPGRVGDSPIIGAGLFVDNKVGAATATGEGEAVLKTLGTFLIVEFMRNGMHPQQACEAAIQRLTESVRIHDNMQVGYLAVNKAGDIGAFSLRKGFQFAVFQNGENTLIDATYLLEWK
ncbi:MAG: N(4)-(beta-N-acetylglucosaminyl)-L-asparaginase [Bacteroidales bacterium]|nr:N(4)-(beta-N-acetylglucosaminyl)-L-asparaginase [Bacteroidales bacterium]